MLTSQCRHTIMLSIALSYNEAVTIVCVRMGLRQNDACKPHRHNGGRSYKANGVLKLIHREWTFICLNKKKYFGNSPTKMILLSLFLLSLLFTNFIHSVFLFASTLPSLSHISSNGDINYKPRTIPNAEKIP